MTIIIKNLDRTQRKLRRLPQQMRRAERNAVNKTVTFATRKIIDPVNKQLGIKKKESRKRLKIERPSSRARGADIKGSITPTNAIIPLRLMKFTIKKVTATRAAVFAQLDLFSKVKRVRRVFVNPKRPGRREPLLRPAGEGRKTVTPFGPSMAVHVEKLVDKKFMDIINKFLNNDFQRRLRKIR